MKGCDWSVYLVPVRNPFVWDGSQLLSAEQMEHELARFIWFRLRLRGCEEMQLLYLALVPLAPHTTPLLDKS